MFNISKEELAAGIAEADAGGEIFHFKNAVAENPSWMEFFRHLDYEAHNKNGDYPPVGNPFVERAVNGVTVKDMFYLVGAMAGRDIFVNMDNFMKYVKDAIGAEPAPVTSFVSLIGGSSSDPHYDCRRTLFWQCHGTSTFDHLASHRLDQQHVPGNVKKTYTLEPGDLVYIGFEVPHNFYVTGPRAAITFTMSPGDGTDFQDPNRPNNDQF